MGDCGWCGKILGGDIKLDLGSHSNLKTIHSNLEMQQYKIHLSMNLSNENHTPLRHPSLLFCFYCNRPASAKQIPITPT